MDKTTKRIAVVAIAIILLIAVILVVGGITYIIPGIGHSVANATAKTGTKFPLYSVTGVPTGVTILGLSNVGVLSNVAGLSGTYWLATAQLGGAQTLNVKASANNFAPNSSFLCNSTCQQNNLQISAAYNYLLYPLQSSGTPVNDYSIGTLTATNGASVQINYATCYGGPLFGTSNLPNTYSYSNTNVSFAGCSNVAAAQQAQLNYEAACQGLSGTPLVTATTAGNPIVVSQGLFGFGRIQFYGSTQTTLGCFQLNGIPYGYVYAPQSPIPKYQVVVNFNGQQSSISDAQTSNYSNQNLALNNVNYGLGVQVPPSETQISVFAYEPVNLPTYGVTSTKSGVTLLSVSAGSVSSTEAVISKGLTSTFSQQYSLSNATKIVYVADQQVASALVNGTTNGQFDNATILLGNGGQVINGQGITGVKLNDPLMIYTRPQIQMLIKAQFVGIYLGVSSFNISSITVNPLRSGSSMLAYVTVSNTGGAQGGYSLLASGGSSDVSVNPATFSGTLNSGNAQTVTFTVLDNANITSNSTRSLTFTVCPNPNISGGPSCVTRTASFKLVPQCNSNQQFNAGTCATLTTIAPPTTTIPAVTGGSNSSNQQQQTNVCNPATGLGCPPLNQSGTESSTGGIGVGWYVLGAFVVVIIGIYIYGVTKKGKRGKK